MKYQEQQTNNASDNEDSLKTPLCSLFTGIIEPVFKHYFVGFDNSMVT
jgi:hypothetical protein